MVRNTIYENAIRLNQSSKFTYIGLPGSLCTDLKQWKDNIEYAYCYELDPQRFDLMERTLHRIIPGRFIPFRMDLWSGITDLKPHFIDLCNFDFCGGPASSKMPEISELDALNRLFVNQRLKKNKEFLVAWTMGPRNDNMNFYLEKNIEFLKESNPRGKIKIKKAKNWFSEKNYKMIRNYMCFIPLISFYYAQDKRYRIEILDSIVYKKIMYFCLLKIIPTENIIKKDEKLSYYENVFNRPTLVYDDQGKLERIERVPLDDFWSD